MATQLLDILPGTLPSGVCYTSEQERLNGFASAMQAELTGGLAFYNYGSTKPDPANQAYPWLRTTDGRWYVYSGVWQSKVNYSTFERRLFVGTLADLVTYDGGDSGSPSPTSGPMWVEDTEFRGRSPMGPGDIPAANPGKTLAVAENHGEGAHTQTVPELAIHNHPPADGFEAFIGYVTAGQPSNFEITGGSETRKMTQTGDTGGTAGAATPFNVVHPVRGCYLVRWSGRLYYVVP